jgi:tetratricopeptide (TPR) repeat protein
MRNPLALAAASLLLLGSLALAQQRARVTGTVVDQSGEPVPDAVIVIENPNNMPATLEKTTNEKGQFTFTGLRPGVWTLSFEADGFHPHKEQFNLGVRDNHRMEVVVERATGAALFQTSDAARTEAQEASRAFEEGDYDRAVELYRAILEKAPDIHQVHYNVALALERKGDWAGAADAYRSYLESDPGNADATLKLATALDRAGCIEEAVPLYEKSASLDPENPIAAFNLALAFFQSERFEESKKHFLRSIELDPGLADAHYMLGHIHLRQGETAAARASYEKFLEMAPDAPNAEAARKAVEQLKQ